MRSRVAVFPLSLKRRYFSPGEIPRAPFTTIFLCDLSRAPRNSIFPRRALTVAPRIISFFLRTALNKLIAQTSVRVTATQPRKRVYTRDSSGQRGRFLSVTCRPAAPPSVARNILTSPYLSPGEECNITRRDCDYVCVCARARASSKSAPPRGILRRALIDVTITAQYIRARGCFFAIRQRRHRVVLPSGVARTAKGTRRRGGSSDAT